MSGVGLTTIAFPAGNTVTAGSEVTADLSFSDTNGNAITPDSAAYFIYDDTNATALSAWITLSPLAPTVPVLIDPTYQTITTGHLVESRLMIVRVMTGGQQREDSAAYWVLAAPP